MSTLFTCRMFLPGTILGLCTAMGIASCAITNVETGETRAWITDGTVTLEFSAPRDLGTDAFSKATDFLARISDVKCKSKQTVISADGNAAMVFPWPLQSGETCSGVTVWETWENPDHSLDYKEYEWGSFASSNIYWLSSQTKTSIFDTFSQTPSVTFAISSIYVEANDRGDLVIVSAEGDLYFVSWDAVPATSVNNKEAASLLLNAIETDVSAAFFLDRSTLVVGRKEGGIALVKTADASQKSLFDGYLFWNNRDGTFKVLDYENNLLTYRPRGDGTLEVIKKRHATELRDPSEIPLLQIMTKRHRGVQWTPSPAVISGGTEQIASSYSCVLRTKDHADAWSSKPTANTK